MSKTKTRSLGNRQNAAINRDIYRLFRTPLLYKLAAFAAVIPGSMQIMMGMESGFNVWETAFGVASAALLALSGIFLAFFVSSDYKSGFVKNVFSVTPKNRSYALSKIVSGTLGGAVMLVWYIIGAAIFGIFAGGDMISGLPDLLGGALGKIGALAMFSGVFVCIDVFFRGKTWLSVLGTLAVGMLLMPAMLISIGSPLAMAGLQIAAGIISIFVFPPIASAVMNSRDLM